MKDLRDFTRVQTLWFGHHFWKNVRLLQQSDMSVHFQTVQGMLYCDPTSLDKHETHFRY